MLWNRNVIYAMEHVFDKCMHFLILIVLVNVKAMREGAGGLLQLDQKLNSNKTGFQRIQGHLTILDAFVL